MATWQDPQWENSGPTYNAESRLRYLTVVQLKSLLKSLGLKISGRKADLVRRIMSVMSRRESADVVHHFLNYCNVPSQKRPPPKPLESQSSKDIMLARKDLATKYLNKLTALDYFYERKFTVTSFQLFRMPQTRFAFTFTEEEYSFLSKNREAKVKLYSLELRNNIDPCKPIHQWPTESILKVNGIGVKLTQQVEDGHKKKSVKERPADITTCIGDGTNYVDLSGTPNKRLGDWSFGIAITIEMPRPISSIIKLVSKSPASVTKDRIKKVFSADNDVITEQMSVGVKCPLSLLRLSIPARGKNCKHLGCFDLKTFLEFQKTAKNATWRCIVCNAKSLTLDTIVIDEWMTNVLKEIKDVDNVDQVEVFENGTFKVILEGKEGLADSDGEGPPAKKRNKRSRPSPVFQENVDFGMQDPFAPLVDPLMLPNVQRCYYPNQVAIDYSRPLNMLPSPSSQQPSGDMSLLGSTEENAIEL
mmetsp:Transcript_6131/g.7019  ORF Transcript_6131/g.7019 Transcript_6131/m.7019 type:complete len:474 (-) Transcript_6131:259-1680(-)